MRQCDVGRSAGNGGLYAAVILVALLQAGLTSARQCSNPDATTTEVIEYDPTETMCCAGVLYGIRVDIQPHSCCGSDLYNPASQSCCDDQVLDNTLNPSLRCCPATTTSSQRVYDSNTEICCQGTLADKTEGLVCCGNAVMDTTQQTCCYDGTRHSPRDGLGQCCGPDKLYNASNEICCEKMVGQDHQSVVHVVGEDAVIDATARCCGLTNIDTTQQRCCDEVPNTKTTSNECCGQTTFDLRSQVCCKGTVSALTNGRTECCATHPFNPANEVCCGFGTQIAPVGHGNCCTRIPYSPVLESCCRGNKQPIPDVDGVQGCCGSEAYLKTDHLCCRHRNSYRKIERQPNRECCGNDSYDSSTEMCCKGVKLQRSSPSLQCCGSTNYDPETETCCHKTDRTFSGSGLSCCHAKTGLATEAFDPASRTCCRGRRNVGVFPEPEAKERCCGQSLLQNYQLCDTARQQPINKSHPDHDAVCRPVHGGTGRPMRGGLPRTYDSEDEICTTAGIMIRLPGEEACGRRIYNTESELCCAGQRHGKWDQYGNLQECCGNSVHVYTPSLQCCFAGGVYNVPQEVAGLCRAVVFNTNDSSCDGHGLVRPRHQVADFPDRCGTSHDISTWTLYNPTDNECCADTLIGPGQTCCSGQVYDTPGTALGDGQCCGSSGGYNPDMNICCNGRLFSTNGRDMECCGGRPHEPTDDSQVCCNDRLYSTMSGRTLCTDGIVHSPQETVCQGMRYDVASGECCGKNIMDDTKICCQGFIYSKGGDRTECCGKVAYDPSAQPQALCCEDSLHLDAQGFQCCGSQAINPAERQCCGVEGHRFAFLRSTGQTCCGDAPGDYDPSQHTCCQGSLHKFLVNGECCGNDVVRDPSKEICCGGLVWAKSDRDDTLCCNGHILDGRRYVCCGDVTLQRRSSLPNECCHGVVFNRNHQQCVGGEVQDKDVEDATVGARRMFARQTEHAQRFTRDATDTMDRDVEQTTHVGGYTAHIEERMMPRGLTDAADTACSGRDYDAEVQGCCRGVLYRLANETCVDGSVLGLCDGRAVYNLLTHGCCGDVVYNRSTEQCDESTTLVDLSTESPGESESTRTSTSAPASSLCGGLVYDHSLKGCCDDRLYDLRTEFCYNGSTVIPMVPSQPEGRRLATTTTTVESTTLDDRTLFSVTQEPCPIIRARENASEELQCCGSLLFDPLNATCCQGITEEGDGTVVAWSAVTEGVVAGRCCVKMAYDSSQAVCCNREILDKFWLTQDVFGACCPEGERWNRFLEACETSPTQQPVMTDGPSGMLPDEY